MLIARPVFLCMVVLGSSDMYIGPTNRTNFGRGVDVKKSSALCDDRLQLCEPRLSYILSVGVRLLERIKSENVHFLSSDSCIKQGQLRAPECTEKCGGFENVKRMDHTVH